MSDTPFHQTRMGHTFYGGTMPSLVRELARLNDNIERLLAVADGEAKDEPPLATNDASPEEHR